MSPAALQILDSHCHLDSEGFDDLAEVIARARAAGVARMVTIGSGRDMTSARQAVMLAEREPFIFATVGVHPHDVARMSDADFQELDEMCAHPRVRGVGETGLDYHYDHSPREVQQAAFVRFAGLAKTHALPLVVHVRDAHADCAEILRSSGVERGVIHCFTGGPEEARIYLDLGFTLSFSGIVTFKNADANREAARICPDDRLLVETDAPYLAPMPLRGKRNEPAFIVHTVARLAELRGVSPEILAAQTWANGAALFQLDTASESD